jgi:D-amino-acid dehydrogenase
VDRAEAVRIEPAFAASADKIVGATYTASDESGDAQAFTAQLARVCERNGVRFMWDTEVTAVHQQAGRVTDVEVKDLTTARYQRLSAPAIVVSLASWSPMLLRPLGIKLNIYPAKGYSVTIPVRPSIGGADPAPQVSLTDDEYKLVYSRLGDRLRVAGTAELSGYDRNLNPTRIKAIIDNVRGLFPAAGDFDNAIGWAGLRPTTPSNVPYLGGTRIAGLYLNTGHGTLGWTMGPGTGARLAEQIAGELGRGTTSPEVTLPQAA